MYQEKLYGGGHPFKRGLKIPNSGCGPQLKSWGFKISTTIKVDQGLAKAKVEELLAETDNLEG